MLLENQTTKYEDPMRTIDPLLEALQRVKAILEENDIRLHSVLQMERSRISNLYDDFGTRAPAVLCSIKIYVPVSEWSDPEVSAEVRRRAEDRLALSISTLHSQTTNE